MKKYLIFTLAVLVFIGLALFARSYSGKSNPSPTPTIASIQQKIEITIDFGNEEKITFSQEYKKDETAFSLLKMALEENNLTLKSKQYDFGVFIEGIGNFLNTKEKAWIFFVNGKSADNAADKIILQPEDLVEWKYIKPTF
jgi:hypothetical protein